MPDSPDYDATQLTPDMSAKFTKLIETLRGLDAKDMEETGTKYKHFIFTDIREASYGVKALASFMIASGYDLRMKQEAKQIKRKGVMVDTKTGATVYTPKEPVQSGSNGFAILQSLPLWKNAMSIDTKKAILGAYNKRPDNVNGELLRIVILDSKYKEGIDLFDVKYVHLLEPAIASSDLIQAVGRATRYCGQKGLHFIPKQGWPLQVYVYHTDLPNRGPFLLGDGQKVDAHDLMLAKSGLDLALMNLTKELTILAITSAVDYDLNYKINNFDLQTALLEEAGVVIAEVLGIKDTQDGGAKDALVNIYTVDDLTPELLTKCQRRQSRLFPFSRARMMEGARALGIRVPNNAKRSFFCTLLAENPKYFEELYNDTRSVRTGLPTPGRATPIDSIDVHSLFPSPKSVASKSKSKSKPKKPLDLGDLADKPFAEFQQGVLDLYTKHTWNAPIVKSGCDTVFAGSLGKPVNFTQTQDFVRHYLTPNSPFKGLLAWHSVGTGKTCMAVAAATTHFEKAGYSILWVTRNALMADVYKNIFGSVCSIPIMEKIQEGVELPKDLSAQKRMLSRAWFAPISYRTFQNALEGKNELGRMLKKKHADPLHKTFLIMDEVHKLQDGDLGAAESANFSVIQKYIHESYTTSIEDSVRPLLMTATPITDSPKDLFELLNTLIPSDARRFMPFDTFRETYTDDKGVISADGRKYFQTRAKGLISYLNRELDPTTFAQPQFHTIRIGVSATVAPSLEALAEKCMAGIPPEEVFAEEEDCSKLTAQMEKDIYMVEAKNMVPKERRELIRHIKGTYKQRIRDCKAAGRATRKARKAATKKLLKETRRCYAFEKKAYKKSFDRSQQTALEGCFGKRPTLDMVSRDEFDTEVQRRRKEGSMDHASVGAVRTPLTG